VPTLTAALVARIPRHSARDTMRWLASGVIDDRECGRCPRCGRTPPLGSIAPAFQPLGLAGPMGLPHTSAELVAACLVDGPRGHAPHDLALADLLTGLRVIQRDLHEKGWGHWASAIDSALARPTDADRAEAAGQVLELIRRAGPPAALKRSSELEIIVVSLARYWPQEAARSTSP
jgi:hypothetical protein